ncbi:MAG TPA: hypothetical protein VL357_09070 [Rariglobus sp.]|jgi:hypothetical protein|nr:hypothetical protein [Rariglobus sp.]
MHRLLSLAALFLFFTLHAGAVSSQFKDAVQARIDKNYAVVVFADGTRSLVPLATISEEDRAWLASLSAEKPLAHGNSVVTVVKPTIPAKHTIVTSSVVGPLETVQLCPPSVERDQIGGTCMLYGRVHWLDIAGYYVDNAAIYKISNVPDQENPWKDSHYLQGMDSLLTGFTPKPIIHNVPNQEDDPFEWTRGELRKGRPILAAFPREIWQALPPGFIAAHPWGGGSVGHQIVINGFTWNKETQKGTFHIINSWAELPEFDLKTDAAKGGALVIEQSMSPKGEPPTATIKEVVKTITFLRAVGKTNLYEVQTNLGTKKIAASSEAAARSLIEDAK